MLELCGNVGAVCLVDLHVCFGTHLVERFL